MIPPRSLTRWVWPLTLTVFAAGCEARTPNGGQKSAPTTTFPTQDDLAKLPSLPPPADAFAANAVEVEEWSPESTPAAQDDEAAYDQAPPWGPLARSIASAHRGAARLSPALQCAAAEIARFSVDKEGSFPNESLRRFLVARCGGTSPDALPATYGGEAPARVSDAELYDRAKDWLEKTLNDRLQGPRHWAFGVSARRAHGRFSVAVVVGADDVVFEAAPRSVDPERRTVFRGTFRSPAADAAAYINRGDFGADLCDRDTREALPRFAFSCRLDDKDSAAWVQIVVHPEGRFLDDSVADVLVNEGDPLKLEYRARPSGPAAPVADSAAFGQVLLTAVNRVRAEGKLAPLSPATKESLQSARLVGTLIDASTKGRSEEADGIALGLLAGWDVEGTIRNGRLFLGLVAPTRDATSWLDFALERPFGRMVLLDPEARSIAIGPVVPAGDLQALGAVVTTYALFESPDHERDSARIFEKVEAARKALGKPLLSRIQGGRELAREARLVQLGEREPMDALGLAMQEIADRTPGIRVSGVVYEANDLDRIPVPKELLALPHGSLVVEVTHHRVHGAAWGQYAILYVYTAEGPGGGASL